MDLSLLKKGIKSVGLAQTITVYFVLQITELLMEHLFTCPCNKYRVPFVWLFFFGPAFVFAAFAFHLRRHNTENKSTKSEGNNGAKADKSTQSEENNGAKAGEGTQSEGNNGAKAGEGTQSEGNNGAKAGEGTQSEGNNGAKAGEGTQREGNNGAKAGEGTQSEGNNGAKAGEGTQSEGNNGAKAGEGTQSEGNNGAKAGEGTQSEGNNGAKAGEGTQSEGNNGAKAGEGTQSEGNNGAKAGEGTQSEGNNGAKAGEGTQSEGNNGAKAGEGTQSEGNNGAKAGEGTQSEANNDAKEYTEAHDRNLCRDLCGMPLYTFLCWFLILIVDGKYLACGLYTKCNSTMVVADNQDPEMMTNKTWSTEAKSVISLVQGISVIILLQVTEHLMEPHFTCPCNKYRFLFLCLFFIVPAIAFIVFSLFLNEVSTLLVKYCTKSKKRKYICSLSSLKITGMILYPPVCWLVILLIDGKYVACGWYRKCNSTMTHADMKDPEVLEDITMSK
ncbi:hypothetical protein JZ751_029755, partial [Albula glossodonta]